jgi:hypothetical protein
VIELDDLPLTARGDYGLALGPAAARNDTLRAWASRYVRLVLERSGGNKREACRALDISYHTLVAYLRFPLPEDDDAGQAPAPEAAGAVVECDSEVGV